MAAALFMLLNRKALHLQRMFWDRNNPLYLSPSGQKPVWELYVCLCPSVSPSGLGLDILNIQIQILTNIIYINRM